MFLFLYRTTIVLYLGFYSEKSKIYNIFNKLFKLCYSSSLKSNLSSKILSESGLKNVAPYHGTFILKNILEGVLVNFLAKLKKRKSRSGAEEFSYEYFGL